MLWQLQFSLPCAPVSVYTHLALFCSAPLCFRLLALCIRFLPTSDPGASTLHSSIPSHILGLPLPLCSHSQSQDPSSPISWFKTLAVPWDFYPLITLPPQLFAPLKLKISNSFSSILCYTETGMRTAYFSVSFAHSSLSTLWGWCHLFTPSHRAAAQPWLVSMSIHPPTPPCLHMVLLLLLILSPENLSLVGSQLSSLSFSSDSFCRWSFCHYHLL